MVAQAFRLPLLTARRRWPAFLGCYIWFSACYLASGRFAWRPPTVLPPTIIDNAIPFLGWTLFIYLSHYALPILAIWRVRDDFARSRVFYAMVGASAFAFILFAAWPTAVARPEETALASRAVFRLMWSGLYALDTPANCLPSLHVTLAILSALALRRLGGAWKWTPLWAAAVAVSTLTTKQHVIADAAAGSALAAAAWIASDRWLRLSSSGSAP